MNDANRSHDEAHEPGEPHFLAHHFGSYRQQFDAGKLGMWIFLLTEILLFGGLFCAYAIFRANHPEIFIYADRFLDKNLGALNTCVLIFSSLTMAWAVRCAQTDRRRGLIVCLVITLVCACCFLGVKGVEYRSKWREGLLVARFYDPHVHAAAPAKTAAAAAKLPVVAGHVVQPEHVGIFFSLYFLMTGLHAVHVLAGMGVIGWILRRAVRGEFGSHYFGPVDYVGLYWHLVDMIWIYLFPLLYLIH
ncbi:MAG: cytochrome c oxidase subunit 3 family protein [Thermoguttaceae bacterium]